jgi:hypothetical protein
MPQAKDIFGTVFKNGSAVLLARIVDAVGEPIDQAAITSISYTIYELDPCRPDLQTAVAGHDGEALSVEDVIYDDLQIDPLWTVDEEGYNFRHEIVVAENEAFPKAGSQYQVRYQLTPATGQKLIVRFQLRSI